MKTRNGFVSNSSSSSFIIRYKDVFDKKLPLQLSKKEIKLLLKNGFSKTQLTHSTRLDNCNYDDTSWICESGELSYGKMVSCNQNDEMYFLVKNNIPFMASIHYGHELAVYCRNSKNIDIYTNYGNIIETYQQNTEMQKVFKDIKWTHIRPYYQINVKKFIKDQEKFNKRLESGEDRYENT